MTEFKVSAITDIRTEGGMLLAVAGTSGTAIAGMKPNRRKHYGLVPVRWGGRRAFWVEGDKLKTRFNLGPCITPLPSEDPRILLPEIDGEYGFDFGRNLRSFRKAKNLSQEELARRMAKAGAGRISQTSISNWERREDCPSGEFLKAAAVVLEVPVFSFFLQLDCPETTSCLAYVQQLKDLLCGGTNVKRGSIRRAVIA